MRLSKGQTEMRHDPTISFCGMCVCVRVSTCLSACLAVHVLLMVFPCQARCGRKNDGTGSGRLRFVAACINRLSD